MKSLLNGIKDTEIFDIQGIKDTEIVDIHGDAQKKNASWKIKSKMKEYLNVINWLIQFSLTVNVGRPVSDYSGPGLLLMVWRFEFLFQNWNDEMTVVNWLKHRNECNVNVDIVYLFSLCKYTNIQALYFRIINKRKVKFSPMTDTDISMSNISQICFLYYLDNSIDWLIPFPGIFPYNKILKAAQFYEVGLLQSCTGLKMNSATVGGLNRAKPLLPPRLQLSVSVTNIQDCRY